VPFRRLIGGSGEGRVQQPPGVGGQRRYVESIRPFCHLLQDVACRLLLSAGVLRSDSSVADRS